MRPQRRPTSDGEIGTEKQCVAAEIQLLTCGYSAQCTVRGCGARATMLATYTDGQGRPLKQRELCDRHAEWLRANRPEHPRFDAFLTPPAARTVTGKQTQI
jgi:hypothetical protein